LADLTVGRLLARVVSLLQDFYYENEYIIREGATGDTFFIINKGEVRLTHLLIRIKFSLFAFSHVLILCNACASHALNKGNHRRNNHRNRGTNNVFVPPPTSWP